MDVVVMADQRGSRRGPDLVAPLLETLNAPQQPWSMRLPFERTAGDEVQGLLNSPLSLPSLIRHFGDSDQWSVGVGFGEVSTPLPASTRAATGSAYLAAREAVENAKRASGNVQLRSTPGLLDISVLEALVQGLYFIQRSRSQAGHEAVNFARRGASGKATAEALGISPQAVSNRLQVAGWDEEQTLVAAITTLIAEELSSET